MFVALIFVLIIIASIIFHFWSPWWWTPVASNWGSIDANIILTFWVTGTVFVVFVYLWPIAYGAIDTDLTEKQNINLKIKN